LIGLLTAVGAVGATESQSPQQQRQLFERVRAQLAAGKVTQARQHFSALRDYPLFPYLELADMKQRPLVAGQVDDFLRRNPDSVVGDQLRELWLGTLASQRRWADFLRSYPGDSASKTQRCWHLDALFQTGDKSAALAAAPGLWLTPSSLPDACDAPLKRWLAGLDDPQPLIWQRLALALQHNQDQLARYLASRLHAPYQAQAQRLLDIHANPGRLPALLPQIAQSVEAGAVISHGLKKLARRDLDGAMQLWERADIRNRLSTEQRATVRSEIGRLHIADAGADALPWLLRYDPDGSDLYLLEWRVRLGLRSGDWPQVQRWIELLPAEQLESQRWSYWRARALAEQRNDPAKVEQARALYAKLAADRSYYGFLAADLLGSEYQLNHQSLAPALTADTVAQRADLRRAREFYLLDEQWNARREWQRAMRVMSVDEQQASALLSQRWGWYDQALRSALQSGGWNDTELRFPLVHRQYMADAAQRTALPTQWLYAIARQESAFMPDARSSAGALGLLQLMPATARQVASKLGLRTDERKLLEPSHSIRLGSQYLKGLLHRFDGNRVLATAAYNAGPGRISRWLKQQPEAVSADIWVETLPYRETREYVQNVLAFSVIYARRLDRPAKLLATGETVIGKPGVQLSRVETEPITALR
jgi:soluble lytic murein transglycosylase